MKTVLIAILLFAAAFGGVMAFGWYNARTPEQAAIEAQFIDALAEQLGAVPAPDAPGPGGTDVKGTYRELQAAYLEMNFTCSAEARQAYAAAFENYILTGERADAAGIAADPDVDQMGTMNQFLDLAGRHVIEASDMPSRRFRLIVASAAHSTDHPTEAEKKLQGSDWDWFRNDDNEVMVRSPCQRLSEG